MNLNNAHQAGQDLTRALRSGDPEAIADCAAANVWPLYTEHPALLASAVIGLPSHILEQHPMLRVLHPMTPVLAHTSRAISVVDASTQSRGASADEICFLTMAEMIILRLSGDILGALDASDELAFHIRDVRYQPRVNEHGPLWYFHYQIGATRLAAGDLNAAIVELHVARDLAKRSIQGDAERMTLSAVAVAYAFRGSHGDARKALAQASQHRDPVDPHADAIHAAETTAAALLAVDRDSDGLVEVLAAMEPYDADELSWPFALVARCRALLMRQQAEEALDIIQLTAVTRPVKPATFAADVIGALSIDAYRASADLTGIRSATEHSAPQGMLTRLATVRAFLELGTFDAAARLLHELRRDESLGPAQRADYLVLSGWLEFVRTGEVTRERAAQISFAAQREDGRRHLASLPREFLERVSLRLPHTAARGFDDARIGLPTIEIVARPRLTAGELRILDALQGSPSTAAMARAFQLSPNTVKSQLRAIYRKLGCSTRSDALIIATRLRLFSDET